MAKRNLVIIVIIFFCILLNAYIFRYESIAPMGDNGVYIVWDRWLRRTCYAVQDAGIACTTNKLFKLIAVRQKSTAQTWDEAVSNSAPQNHYEKIIYLPIVGFFVFIFFKRKAIYQMISLWVSKFYFTASANTIVHCITNGIPGWPQAISIIWVSSLIGKFLRKKA